MPSTCAILYILVLTQKYVLKLISFHFAFLCVYITLKNKKRKNNIFNNKYITKKFPCYLTYARNIYMIFMYTTQEKRQTGSLRERR